MKHAVSVGWFQQDSSAAIFVVPPDDSAPRSIVEKRDDRLTTPHNRHRFAC